MKRLEANTGAPSTLFAALGDATRLRIVIRLSRGDTLSIKELAAGTKLTRQAVTKHLHVLSTARIAIPSKKGREQFWTLDREQLAQAQQFLDRLAQQWENKLASLKNFVEESE